MPPLGYADSLHYQLLDATPKGSHGIDIIVEQTLMMMRLHQGIGETKTDAYKQLLNILSYLYETRRDELNEYMNRKYSVDTTNVPKTLLLQMLNIDN
jgi:hypothetical protein